MLKEGPHFPMEQRLSVITLGVSDLKRAYQFYAQGLGWKASNSKGEKIYFFPVGGPALALYPRELLAEDALLAYAPPQTFCGVTLAHNVRMKEEVAQVLSFAEAAGGKILKPAQDVFWGGHSGYFADPDGYPWEVCFNPFFPLDEQGHIQLPMN